MYTHMDRAIFHLNASVPATSLYILVCSLLDEGQVPTVERARQMWTGTEDNFKDAIDELKKRGILDPPPQWANGNPERFYLNLNWRKIA